MFMFFGINAILSMWPIGKINLASGEKIIIIKLIYQSFLCVRVLLNVATMFFCF